MKCRGFTIAELLVATLLLSLLTAGGLTTWVHSRAAWQQASIEQILNERAQYVFATLEPDLQMAGYFGQSPAPAPLAADSIPPAARSCGLPLIQQLDRPIAVSPEYDLPCAARGGGAMNGSMQLIVRRASAQPAAATPGRAQWLGSITAGQLVWNETATTAPLGTERRDLLLRVYYIARAADGDAATPALRVKSLGSIAGAPAFIDTEVMPGVEALQADLLPPDAPRSLRLTLALRPDQADTHRQALQRLTFTRQFTLRNAPAD